MNLPSLADVLANTPVEPDPAVVTPGLLGLAITVGLGLAIVVLFKSMNRQLKRVNLPDDAVAVSEAAADAAPDDDEPTPQR